MFIKKVWKIKNDKQIQKTDDFVKFSAFNCLNNKKCFFKNVLMLSSV